MIKYGWWSHILKINGKRRKEVQLTRPHTHDYRTICIKRNIKELSTTMTREKYVNNR